MKKQTRRKFNSSFKAKVVLEAIRGQHTLAEIALKYELSQVVISRWKAEFLENMGSVFERPGKSDEPDVDTQELYAQIGQLRVENEFLKKSCKKLGI